MYSFYLYLLSVMYEDYSQIALLYFFFIISHSTNQNVLFSGQKGCDVCILYIILLLYIL